MLNHESADYMISSQYRTSTQEAKGRERKRRRGKKGMGKEGEKEGGEITHHHFAGQSICYHKRVTGTWHKTLH